MANVLVVEDEEGGRHLLSRVLQGANHTVYETDSAFAALRIASEEPIDLVIADILTPELDGFDLCRRWTTDEALRDKPFVIYSAVYTESEDRALAMQMGAARHLVKPMDPDALVSEIEAVLREARPTAGDEPELDEATYLRSYSGRVAHELDEKVVALEDAHRALQLSERRLRVMLESSADAIIGAASDGTISLWSRAAESIFGYEAGELMGQSTEVLVPPELREEERDRKREARERGTVVRWETKRLRKDGTLLDVEIALTHLGDELGCSAVIRDLTQTRRAAAELDLARERLALVLSASPVVIYSVREEGEALTATWVSSNVESLYGWSPQEAMAPDWWVSNVHEEDRPAAVKAAASVLSTGSVEHEYRFRSKSGEYRWVRDELRLLPARDGGVREVVGAWLDVSDRRLAEQEEANTRQQLAQAQKLEALGTLAGGVAHDFNNILGTILLSTGFWRESLDPRDPGREVVAEVIEAAERGAVLTQQLLAFSRRESVEPQRLDLSLVVEGLARMLRRMIGEDVRLELALAEDLPQVMADRGQMEQVLLNLAVNARDAMPRGGLLRIETSLVTPSDVHARDITLDDGQWVQLRVVDSGVGMDAMTQARIFEPFFTTKEPGRGTGLGLATAYGIVRQAGGQIAVTSARNEGAVIDVYLPAVGAAIARVEQEPSPWQYALGGTETILIVEDEETLCRLFARLCRGVGYRVLSTTSPGEALLLCERHPEPIDLMVSDVVMPHMSGPELAERVQPLRPEMRVLFMTGYADDSSGRHGLPDDGAALIRKPFTGKALLHKIRARLEPAE